MYDPNGCVAATPGLADRLMINGSRIRDGVEPEGKMSDVLKKKKALPRPLYGQTTIDSDCHTSFISLLSRYNSL